LEFGLRLGLLILRALHMPWSQLTFTSRELYLQTHVETYSLNVQI
jgi:hypothetical protein